MFLIFVFLFFLGSQSKQIGTARNLDGLIRPDVAFLLYNKIESIKFY